MKRLLISSLGIFTLFGCASTVDVTTVPNSAEMQQVSRLQNILWNEVEVSSSFSFDISDKSQRLHSPTIDSTVAGFTFPYNGNPTQITLTSAIKNLSVFAPNLAIYDQNFKLIRTYSAKSLTTTVMILLRVK